MSNINLAYFDRVRYTLKNKNFSSLIITEPIGWNSDEKELSRHDTYHGIIANFSNSLKFIKDGAEFIQLVFDLYGINEQIELVREERHPITDVWTLTYSGFLDLSTWAKEKNQISLKFNSGGLQQLLKSRETEKIEIDRITTIDGKSIPELEPVLLELDGRRIFLKSVLENSLVPDNNIGLGISSSGQTVGKAGSFPLKIINKSHEEISTIPNQAETTLAGDATANMMFFLNSNTNRVLDLSIDLKYVTDVILDNEINFGSYNICLTTYQYGSAFNIKNRRLLHSYNYQSFSTQLGSSNPFVYGFFPFTPSNYVTPQTHQLYHNEVINLLQGESLALEVYINCDLGSNTSDGRFLVQTIGFANIKINEDSFQEKSITKSILAHELAERLVTIATNNDKAFYSEFLGRPDVKNILGQPINYIKYGSGALTSFCHGFWVRGFDKLPIPSEVPFVENNFKPLSTSFKDFAESMNAVWNIGIGIEKIGFGERVRIEDKRFFFNKNITIRLPNQVKNVKRKVAADKYYSSLEFGYDLGGSYDEACGLDEYNTKSNFTTIINRIKNSYSSICNYRADSYGMEFARRKQKALNNTEDTSYDNNIWINDVIRGVGSFFKQRKWRDDFLQIPTGTFSPETATNLRFSPVNCMLRHAWWFGGGLTKYLTEKVRYGSSIGNSKLKTKLIGGNEYAENGDILNSDFLKPYFLPEEIEFEHVCDFDVMQIINGTTVVLGKTIQNFYGLVEFINENGNKETGFLMNLKPNDKGNFRILKANI